MMWKKKSKILIINKLYIKNVVLLFAVQKNKKKNKKKTESKNPNVLRAKNGRIMLLSKCASYV